MIKKAIAVGTAALLLCGNAGAAWSSGSGVIDNIELETITGGSQTYLGFATTPGGKPACGTSGFVIVTGSVEHQKVVTSAATAAFLAGKNVRVFWTGSCTGAYAQITHIGMT